MKYYSVINKKGMVFNLWSEAKIHINGDSIYKSFKTKKEAQAYVYVPQFQNTTCDNIQLYIDGSHLKKDNVTGWAVYESFNSKYNYSSGQKGGTNNLAELKALKKALEIVKNNKKKYFIIHTDSKYVMYIYHDVKKDVLIDNIVSDERKDEIKNCLDREMIDRIFLNKVPAHSNVHGNEMADMMAKNTARKYI